MQILKKWRERREQKRRHREALRTLQLWSWLEKIFESGQLSFDYENHRLFITQTMASLMMVNGADGWAQAVHNIYEYTHFLQTQKAWEEFMQKEELAAVRQALSSVSNASASKISLSDIERIKHARRQEIALSDMEQPKTEPFEFFIIPNSTEAKIEPIAIGHYDPSTGEMEVATWEEVKPFIDRS